MALKSTPTRVATGAYDGEKSYGIFHAVTNDTAAEVETNGYLDQYADSFTEGTGDILHCVNDQDGTARLRTYLVTRTGSDIALSLSVAQ